MGEEILMKDPSFAGKIFELVVVSHQVRQHERVYFWYSAKDGKEVDLLFRETDGIELWDIKWGAHKTYRALNKEVGIIHPADFLNASM